MGDLSSVWKGEGGGLCCQVACPPRRQHRGGTLLLTANESAGWLLYSGSATGGVICYSPIVAALMVFLAFLTVCAGAQS